MNRTQSVLVSLLVITLGGGAIFGYMVLTDKRTLDSDLKALTSQDPIVRQAAAVEIQRIVERYPSHTVNILERDGGASRWTALLSQVTYGMPEPQVATLLNPTKTGSKYDRLTSHYEMTYRLDYHWTVVVEYDPFPGRPMGVTRVGRPQADDQRMLVMPDPANGFTGTWKQYYANGSVYDETPIVGGYQSGPPTKFVLRAAH